MAENFRKLDGTVVEEFSIGLGNNRVFLRSNAGILELKNNSGAYYVPGVGSIVWEDEYFTVDLTIQGSNQITLLNTPVTKSEFVFLNGIKMRRGAGRDYTISGAVITFEPTWSLEIGDEIEVQYVY